MTSIPISPHKSSPLACPSASCRFDGSRLQHVCGFRRRSPVLTLIASGRDSSTASLALMRVQEQTGTRACNSIPGKILLPVRHRAAPSRTSCVTERQPADKLSSSSRELRCSVPVAFTSVQLSKMPRSQKCSSEAALFLLQADAFSCHDARDFNRCLSGISNEFGAFHAAVDAQALISVVFALTSPLPTSP